jgi:hypothetical protein
VAALRNARSSHPKEQVYSELTSKQHYKLLHPKDADHHYHFEQLRASSSGRMNEYIHKKL